MMIEEPAFEDRKKVCLELGLEICTLGISPFKYFSGYEQDKNGETKEVYKETKSPFLDMQKSYITKFKNDFNNLPKTKNALMEYDNEIAKFQKDIDDFNKNFDEYLNANPEIKQEYKKNALPFIIATESRMASRASVHIRRLDNIQGFALIPYSPTG